jgi:hypothetical protein
VIFGASQWLILLRPWTWGLVLLCSDAWIAYCEPLWSPRHERRQATKHQGWIGHRIWVCFWGFRCRHRIPQSRAAICHYKCADFLLRTRVVAGELEPIHQQMLKHLGNLALGCAYWTFRLDIEFLWTRNPVRTNGLR